MARKSVEEGWFVKMDERAKRIAEIRKRVAINYMGQSVLKAEDDVRWFLSELNAAQHNNDNLSDRLDLERVYHDETRGYRQHAEKQIELLKVENAALLALAVASRPVVFMCYGCTIPECNAARSSYYNKDLPVEVRVDLDGDSED